MAWRVSEPGHVVVLVIAVHKQDALQGSYVFRFQLVSHYSEQTNLKIPQTAAQTISVSSFNPASFHAQTGIYHFILVEHKCIWGPY